MENFSRGFVSVSADNRSNQYKAFRLSAADTVTVVTSINQVACGVLQNKPESVERSALVLLGVTRMMASGTVTFDERVTLTTGGTFATAGSGDVVYGHAHETVSSGEYFQGLFVGGLSAETITQT